MLSAKIHRNLQEVEFVIELRIEMEIELGTEIDWIRLNFIVRSTSRPCMESRPDIAVNLVWRCLVLDKMAPSVPWWVVIGLIVFRVVNALLVRSFFNPDEYWQCLEVAHRVIFGFGHLTWEWTDGLRSFFHPMMTAAPVYLLLKWLRLDHPLLMVPWTAYQH